MGTTASLARGRVDARTMRVHVDNLRTNDVGFVHELKLTGVRDADGEPPLHPVAYYTVQRVLSSR